MHRNIVRPFVNGKGYFSIILQSLVDHWGHFIDIYVAWSCRHHDARVFPNSSLCTQLEPGSFFL